jgi:hypothetical protein
MFINVNALEHSLNDMVSKSFNVFMELQIGDSLDVFGLNELIGEIELLICN